MPLRMRSAKRVEVTLSWRPNVICVGALIRPSRALLIWHKSARNRCARPPARCTLPRPGLQFKP